MYKRGWTPAATHRNSFESDAPLVSTANLDDNPTMVLPSVGDLNGHTNNNFNFDDDYDIASKSSCSSRRHSFHTARTLSQGSKFKSFRKKFSVGALSTASSTDRQHRLKLLERYLEKRDSSAALKLAVENLQTHPFEFHRVDEDGLIKLRKKRSCSTIFQYAAYLHKNVGLRHIFLILLLIGYALVGGAIFDAIERPNEISDLQSMHKVLLRRIGNISEEIISIVFTYNDTDRQTEVESIVKEFYKDMLDLEGRIKNSVFDKIDNGRRVWDFSSAVFYSSTLFTTIGYGTIACVTAWGKAISIIYSIIGIPLMLVVINDMGRVLFFILQKLYNRIYQLCRRTRLCRKSDEDDTVEHTFPLRLSVPLVFVYILVCAVVVNMFDNELRSEDEGGLSMGDSFYFAFISITTIGLGDIMPNNIQYHPFMAGMLLFGLALLSVINSTIYVHMERNYFRAMEAMEEVLEEMHAEEIDEEIRGHNVFRSMSDAMRIATLAPPNIVVEESRKASTNTLENLGTMPNSLRNSMSSRHSLSSLRRHPRFQSTGSDVDSYMPSLGALGFNLGVVRELSELTERQELANPSFANNRQQSRSDTNLFFVRPRRMSLLSNRSLRPYRRINSELHEPHTIW